MWSLSSVRCGCVPIHHALIKKRATKPDCSWRSHTLRGCWAGEKPCILQMRDAQAKDPHRECEVEAKCVMLYFVCETCQACLQPYKNTHKPILSQPVWIFIVFPRGRKQSAHKLHSYSPHVNFIFQHSYDGFNFTLISLEGKSITEKKKKYISSALPSAWEWQQHSPSEETGNATVIFITSTCISWILTDIWKML